MTDQTQFIEELQAIISRRPNGSAGERHRKEWNHPTYMTMPIVSGVALLADYALSHHERFDAHIGQDYVLGRGWMSIANGLQVMLNGETGNLDPGTVDEMLHALAKLCGFSETESDTLTIDSD